MKDDAPPPDASVAPIKAAGRYVIDLTGPHSHTLVREAGVGSLSIGFPTHGRKVDLQVAVDQRLDWSVFDRFAVPNGSPWPRWLHYTGSDAGFFEWARSRPVERVEWHAILPTDRVVDAGQSQVHELAIRLEQPGGQLRLRLPARSASPRLSLSLEGDLSRFAVEGDVPRRLRLAPRTSRRRMDLPFHLPDLGVLERVESLTLHNDPMAQPMSLGCLHRFSQLRSLSLWGNFTDLGQLADQPRLESLGLRYMPDLGGLPSLDTWEALDTVVAFNIEEVGGKRLRRQMRERVATRPFRGQASVSKLRGADWWEAEYGRPFSAWPARLARLANKAFDAALAALSGAHDLAEAEAAVTAFIVRFNGLEGIETTEREDLAEAVRQLSQVDAMTRLGGTEDGARQWFDRARRY